MVRGWISRVCPIVLRPMAARAVCWIVLAAGGLAFGLSLDRYPRSYIDESFYNYPAIRYLHGRGFGYAVSSTAPAADRLWAYHGPFFPRFQVATFWALGVSERASRLPQFVAAYLAVGLLCEVLVARGFAGAAVVLAVAWVGDRSSQEVLYGRMEGIALLCLAAAFGWLVTLLERPSWVSALAVGACLGMAAGFHPVTLAFGAMTGVLAVVLLPRRELPRAFGGLVVGASVPAALVLWCWWPDLRGALAQFRWNLGQVSGESLPAKLVSVLSALRWSRYWALGLAGAVVFALLPATLIKLRAGRAGDREDGRDVVWFAASGFAGAGLACLLGRAVYPYYLVYFTVWPVVALAITPRMGPWNRGFTTWIHVVTTMVGLCWLPSAAWNGMRLRESILFHRQLDHAGFRSALNRRIPPGALVVGDPILLLPAEEARVDFRPLPWYSENAPAPPGAWLLLTRAEWENPRWIARESLLERPLIEAGNAIPEPGPFRLDYVVLGPRPSADSRPGP